MKKFIKIAGVSLFVLLFFLVTIELILTRRIVYMDIFNPRYFVPEQFRQAAIYPESNKKPIFLMGCSFFQDIFLKNDDLAHTLMSKKTQRNVYNLGVSGGSPVETLYIIRNAKTDPVLKQVLNNEKEVEHIIYNYMHWHVASLQYCSHPGSCVRYKKTKDNSLVQYDNPILNLLISREIENTILFKLKAKDFSRDFDLFIVYMKEIKKAIEETYGKDTKFTVLVVKDSGKERWDEVKELGINVININELLGFNINTKEYAISDTNDHPNKKAWGVIVPALIKELNL